VASAPIAADPAANGNPTVWADVKLGAINRKSMVHEDGIEPPTDRV
jgi:hypothetical protein